MPVVLDVDDVSTAADGMFTSARARASAVSEPGRRWLRVNSIISGRTGTQRRRLSRLEDQLYLGRRSVLLVAIILPDGGPMYGAGPASTPSIEAKMWNNQQTQTAAGMFEEASYGTRLLGPISTILPALS